MGGFNDILYFILFFFENISKNVKFDLNMTRMTVAHIKTYVGLHIL